MEQTASGAVSFVACISPTHAPVTSAGTAPGFRRYQQPPSSAPKVKKTSGVSWM